MKKLFILIGLTFILVGCGKIKEVKRDAIISNTVKNSLYYPDTYDPVSTETKTLRFNIFNEYVIEQTKKIFEILDEIENVERDLKFNQNRAKYFSEYKSKVNEDKNKINELNKNIESYIEETTEYFKRIKDNNIEEVDLVEHKFRCKNGMGLVKFCDYIFIFDKDNNVLNALDGNSDEVLQLMALLNSYEEDFDNKIDYQILKKKFKEIKKLQE